MANLTPDLPESNTPVDHNYEGGDSPASTPLNHGNKRRKVHEDAVEPALVTPVAFANPSKWQTTIENVVKAIVSIRFSQVSAFDTEGPETSEASGFIVDAQNGIILTNRHVACAGPFVGEAICHDHEEVDVFPIYRDPIHDFGFLKFDPKKIKYMPVTQVELRPELAQVGLDIRVVGNDAGEKLSILAGSISRLDRNTPDYGELTYNDFNTFYLQAASSTSGGSSGSPVIDIDGNAVALQAGGHTKAATDFFLPLDRIKRALQLVQRGLPVSRGDIQTHFVYRPYDEARRLGLQPATEDELRKIFKQEIGLLVVETVLPGGPAYGKLEEGDILLTMNKKYITTFVPFEDMLDSHVHQNILIGVERGGQYLEFNISVGDLHAITPDRYVEIGGSKLNNLSYQLARMYCVPCKGVYVCEPSGMFRLDGPDNGWIIKSVDDRATPDLDTFIQVMREIPDRARVPVVYHAIADAHTILMAVVQVERHWSPFRLAVRNDITGLWDFTDLGAPLPPRPIAPSTKRFVELDDSNGPCKELIRCLVRANFSMPCRLDGFPRHRKQGTAIILDATRGFVLVSRNLVPTTMGDLTFIFAESIVIPGKILYLHPTQNFALAQYDPALIGETNVMSAPLSDVSLLQGNKVTLIAHNRNQRPVCIHTSVTDVACITIPHSGTPRFRAVNFEAMTLDTPLAVKCSTGLLASDDGRVQGFWLNFLGETSNSGHDTEYHLGIDVNVIKPVLEKFQLGQDPAIRMLGAELVPVQMAQAASIGLSDEWIKRVQDASASRHQLFMVIRTDAGSPTADVLQELDMILTINGQLVTRLNQADAQYTHDVLEMTILRQKRELTVQVATSRVTGEGTNRVVSWAGAVFHEPHQAVLQQSKTLPSHIYISSRAKGSPAFMYGLVPTMWVTHINSTKVETLDDLITAVKDIPDNTYVRVRVVTFDNVPLMLSVKMVNHYFPLSIMQRDPEAECGWSEHTF